MDEETLRELIRSQREREALQLLQQRQLEQRQQQHQPQQQQQQQQQQQRRDSENILQQLNQGLGATTSVSSASLLSRARSPMEAPSLNPSGLEQLLANQSLLSRARSPVEAPAPAAVGVDQLLGNQRRSSLLSASSQANPFASAATGMRTSTAGILGTSGRDLSSLAVSQEIKRLQQLQQQMAVTRPSPVNNPFLFSSQSPLSSPATLDPNSTLLQQYLMQKSQLPGLSQTQSALGANLASNATLPSRTSALSETPNQSILESQLLQEARMIMRPSEPAPTTFAAAASTKAPAPFPPVPSVPAYEGNRKMRGGVIEPFPEKLHRLLLEVELTGRSDVISFVSEGRAFAIHKSEAFFREIVPLYFKQSRLSSFKRQLNLYGFELINSGPARGAYYHELFQRDRPELCRRMRRVAVKVSAAKPSASSQTHADSDKERSDSESSNSSDEEADQKVASVAADDHPSSNDQPSRSSDEEADQKVASVGGNNQPSS